jgi:hypothetical protein
MPGLDPGIHQAARAISSMTLDGRVEPRHDEKMVGRLRAVATK